MIMFDFCVLPALVQIARCSVVPTSLFTAMVFLLTWKNATVTQAIFSTYVRTCSGLFLHPFELVYLLER